MTPGKPLTFDLNNPLFFSTGETESSERSQRPGHFQAATPPHQLPLRPRRPKCSHGHVPFGVATKRPFADYSRAFRSLIGPGTDSNHVLASGVEVVLLIEVVRNSVSEQCPSLMPVLYPGDLATPFGSINEMWLAFGGLSTTVVRLPPSTAKHISLFHPSRVFLCIRIQAAAHKANRPHRSLSKAHRGHLANLS